jgi:glycine cleavage system transcriptional repressor
VTCLSLSAIGRDRPGIVAEVTAALLRHELNIEDSQMAILGGHFAMMLLLSAPAEADLEALRDDLERVRQSLGLEALTLSAVDELAPATAEPSHVVTLYGADHPGIVHAVSAALAERGVNIADLNTKLVGSEPRVYVMMLEVGLPEGLSGEELEALLRSVAEAQGLELSLHPLDQVAL